MIHTYPAELSRAAVWKHRVCLLLLASSGEFLLMAEEPGDIGDAAGERFRVGLMKAKTPTLAKDGVFIAIFTNDSVLRFYGNIQVRVLGGVLRVESHIMKSSSQYISVSVPMDRSSTAVSLEVVDPDIEDNDFEEALQPFRHAQLLHFHSNGKNRNVPCGKKGERDKTCIQLDLGKEDVQMLNSLVQSPSWDKVWAVALLKPLNNHMTEMLSHHGYNIDMSQQLPGFVMASSHQTVKITDTLRHSTSLLASYPGACVLICGNCGTGKSTLAKYLINSLLNRYAVVGYLECDPGQCEFTCPEVLSLHLLTEPAFGPPYVHHRKPYKAYYYGDRTPKADPEYYIRILRSLHASFHSDVGKSLPHIPLIVNTCGWLNDMGIQLFLDVVRSISPTHIIRLLLSQSSMVDTIRLLPPLNETLFTSTPGLFTPPDKGCGHGCGQTSTPYVGVEAQSVWPSGTYHGEASEGACQMAMGGDSSSDLEMYGSSEDGFHVSDISDEECSPPSHKDRKSSGGVKHPHKRLQVANAKSKRRAMLERQVTLEASHLWQQVLTYRILQTVAPYSKTKNSSRRRKLGYLCHFSDLLPVATRVCGEHGLCDPHQNLLLYVPPQIVPWRDVAIHILHKDVSVDHVLYSLNGRLVCLGHVEADQIKSQESPDLFRVLKSSTPLINYVGLGLVRGIDSDNRMLYLTTPLQLDRGSSQEVNVLVLGHPDSMATLFQDHSPGIGSAPYKPTITPTELGKYQWNPK